MTLTDQLMHIKDMFIQNLHSNHIDSHLHSPKGLLGTPVQFLINAII